MLIEADPALLQRTVANLLDNELKHLAAGHTVVITLDQTPDCVKVTVEDDGAGFPNDLLPAIFARYTKGPQSQGYGLGLAFVSAVIRSHDGTVSACNREPGGACISFDLPLRPVAILTGVAR